MWRACIARRRANLFGFREYLLYTWRSTIIWESETLQVATVTWSDMMFHDGRWLGFLQSSFSLVIDTKNYSQFTSSEIVPVPRQGRIVRQFTTKKENVIFLNERIYLLTWIFGRLTFSTVYFILWVFYFFYITRYVIRLRSPKPETWNLWVSAPFVRFAWAWAICNLPTEYGRPKDCAQVCKLIRKFQCDLAIIIILLRTKRIIPCSEVQR